MGISAEGEDVKFRVVAFRIDISFKPSGVAVLIDISGVVLYCIRECVGIVPQVHRLYQENYSLHK